MHLFNQTRKEILQAIAKIKSSASDIAKQVNLSLPYTLSQLAILEAAGQVIKTKSTIKAHGKPRLIYSINKTFIELNVFTKFSGSIISYNNSQESMKNYLKILSRIPPLHATIFSEYYWLHNKENSNILATGFLSSTKNSLELLTITTKEHLEDLRRKISHFERKNDGTTTKIACWVHTAQEIVEGVKNNDPYYKTIYSKNKPILDKEGIFENMSKGIMTPSTP